MRGGVRLGLQKKFYILTSVARWSGRESESVQKSDEDFGKPKNDLPNQGKN